MKIKTDEQGRIALPAEFRRLLKIESNDEVEISLKSNKIILEKAVACRLFCCADENIAPSSNLLVCSFCLKRFQKYIKK